jgi:cellulose synthase/poly-beta-1,6-N-acetylglucosamine synthase-like glycosyltransferase
MILQILCAIFLIPALLFGLYYGFLCLFGMRRRPPLPRALGEPCHSFAIVIPAHNEETILPDVLCSCADLDYPADKVKVYVIADNCTDQTARIARHYGTVCLERHDPVQRGKGHALAWGLERVLPERPDAIVILDADCQLDGHALRIFDKRLCKGEAVLQGNYVAANPDESMVSYLAGVTNRLENDLFYAPKSSLGLAVLLRGTGMVFRRSVLERCPWREHSIVEDAEYTLRLFEAGIRVHYVEEILVASAFPARRKQLMVQRARWIGGNYVLGRARALGLIMKGLRTRSLWHIDFGWTLIACVRSLVVAELLVAWVLALLCLIVAPGAVSEVLFLVGGGLLALHTVTFACAVVRLGINPRRLRLLCHAPRIIARLLFIASLSAIGGQPVTWERTPR